MNTSFALASRRGWEKCGRNAVWFPGGIWVVKTMLLGTVFFASLPQPNSLLEVALERQEETHLSPWTAKGKSFRFLPDGV